MTDKTTIRATVGNDHTEIYVLPTDVVVERDVMIPTAQGPRLAANVFRPLSGGPWPVIMCCTTYGKDLHPLDYTLTGRGPANRSIGLDMGDMRVSEATPFEAADPGYWVPHGFVVVHVDALGSGKSEGGPALGLGDEVVAAFCDAIGWAADQEWSTGKVGLNGVSYLAAVQWRIAARRPRGLTAIVPWEGFTDVLADVVSHGGIPETAFFPWWMSGEKSASPADDGGPFFVCEKPTVGPGPLAVFEGLPLGLTPNRSDFPVPVTDFGAIEVPILVCGSWSAQGLHSRGALKGFAAAASKHKHLYTHGRHEWTVSNSIDALNYQRAFYERYLLGRDVTVPRVRLEVRRSLEEYEARFEDDFPPKTAKVAEWYLDSASRSLVPEPIAAGSSASYESQSADDRLVFRHRFAEDTEISGPMALRCFMSTSAGFDLDLFVGVRKIDERGSEVRFWNRLSRSDIVTRGWLRASRRPDPPTVVSSLVPVADYDRERPVVPGEVVELNVEILPSSTSFEAGSSLVLELRGRDITELPNFQHHRIFNCGRHTLFTGGEFPSRLLVPVVRRS
ncbi:MAG: CocE/NonD family hydrolase [Ilumatobacteraceae bacterium]